MKEKKYSNTDLNACFDFLIDTAYRRNISFRQLCEGIYDYRSFINMINGKRNPTFNIVACLSERLDIPLSVVFANVTSSLNNQLAEIRKIVHYCITTKKFEEIASLLEQIESMHDYDNCLVKQQYLKAKSIYTIEVDHDYTRAKQYVLEGMLLTYPVFDESDYDLLKMTVEEISLLNILAMIHCYENEIEQAYDIVHEICLKVYLDEKFTVIYSFFILMQCYLKKHEYTMMETTGLRALKIIEENCYFQLNGEIFYLLCKCYICLNDQENFTLYYNKLLSFIDLFGINFDDQLSSLEKLRND